MVERIIEFCARNRVLVLVVVAVAVVGSSVTIRRAKLDAIPDLSDPQVIVYSEWMGRSPTLVEDQVTYPIVSKLIGTPHVSDVRGFSMFGMSFVYVVFEEGTDVYWARSRVLEYLSGLRGRYGLRVADVERVIESAIGGTPIGTTVEGRNRFTINVRYPRDLRGDLEALRRILIPVGRGGAGMPAGGGSGMGTEGALWPPRGVPGQEFVPLGDVADVRIAGGPPMVRDEAGLLIGYVYIDIDQGQRDIGGYVNEAKDVVARALAHGTLTLPSGTYLKWTGQYKQLEEMTARMKIVVPLTLLIIFVLLFLQFRNVIEVLIILLSIPFALVGSVWLLWLLDYRISTAVWVGVIALVGLAAQTGIVMIVYIDNAFHKRQAEGRINNLQDIIAAHMEGTVQRVRPKLMTVSTMLIGLVPLLWATNSGADVMKRIAAPMVGGLLTSAFLTLEIIPVVVTYWRQEELLWHRLGPLAPARLQSLRRATAAIALGAALAACLGVVQLYMAVPPLWFALGQVMAAMTFLGGVSVYLSRRPAAYLAVWPAGAAGHTARPPGSSPREARL